MFRFSGKFGIESHGYSANPLSAKFIKLSNTLKQFVGKLPTNCLSMFDHFVGLALKGLKETYFLKMLGVWFCVRELYLIYCLLCRSSHRGCSLKIGVLKNVANLSGKDTMKMKERLQHRCFL